MNGKRTFWKGLLPSVTVTCASAILCALTVYKPEMFASSMPLNFFALATGARAIWRPAQASFLRNGAAFFISLSGILILSSAQFSVHTFTLRLLGCWALAWLSLLFALKLFLPLFGIGFRPPNTRTPSPLTPEPERVAWQWTHSVYAEVVFLPIIGLAVFFVVGLGMALVGGNIHPQVNLEIDPGALVLIALLLPLGNLILWFLFLDRESRIFLVRSDMPIELHRPATIVIAIVVLAWGALIQVHYSTGRLLSWAICGSLISILLGLMWKLGQKAPQSSAEIQPPPLPKSYSLFIRLQVVVLLLSGWIYSTLALSAR